MYLAKLVVLLAAVMAAADLPTTVNLSNVSYMVMPPLKASPNTLIPFSAYL